MITISSTGEFKNTDAFLKRMSNHKLFQALHNYGQQGITALSAATPTDTGETAQSWSYEVRKSGGTYSIIWSNSNVNAGQNIAVLIQYGHGTKNGGYVQGYDYINPAIRPVFDKIAADVWKEVTSA